MKTAVMYTTATCPYCLRAKQLLQEKNIAYHEIRVDLDEQQRDKMIALTGRRTVPQIYIDDQYIGGCDDLFAHFKKISNE